MEIQFILILTFVLSSHFGFGQENKTADFNASDLFGTWFPIYNFPIDNQVQGELTFEKKVLTDVEYGLRIEILENGEFRNRYTAPCLNDTMIYTHNYKGTWNLDQTDWILTTSEPLNLHGQVYHIKELSSDRLVLVEIKPE